MPARDDNSGVRESRVAGAYGIGMLLVVASAVISIAGGGGPFGAAAAGFFQGLTLIVILQVSEVPRRALLAFTGIAAATMFLAVGLAYSAPTRPGFLVPFIWITFLLVTMTAIARHLRTYHSVTIQVVLGLLTMYLLVGLLFAHVYTLVSLVRGGFFVGGQTGLASFVYFSYVTLATVGYGDLVASEGWPRALAVAEAVLGQLYLVSVVALAVGRFGRERASGPADVPRHRRNP